ncbi:FHA domain-containing protein [bacterium]|nr:FHA domain-containing protein [bacterium]
MIKLIVENDKNELSIHDFVGNLVTVGRAPNNDLVLDERNISRHHFQLELVDNRIVITDSGSYNSTFVNDREIEEATEIFIGDIISAGDYNIYIEEDDENSLLKTTPLAIETTVSVVTTKIAEDNLLLAKNNYIGGKVFALTTNETVIGSHASADVYIFGPDIPALHSKIIFDGNMYLLVKGDYQGDYSLVVNDMEINSVDLRNGDEIRIGDFLFEFIEKGEEYDPTPYQAIAEETRKEKLRKDMDNNRIKSIRNDEVLEIEEEVTDIKPIVMQPPAKSRSINLIPIIIVAAIVLAIAGFFIFTHFKG